MPKKKTRHVTRKGDAKRIKKEMIDETEVQNDFTQFLIDSEKASLNKKRTTTAVKTELRCDAEISDNVVTKPSEITAKRRVITSKTISMRRYKDVVEKRKKVAADIMSRKRLNQSSPERDDYLTSRRAKRRDNITTPVRQSDAERKANARKNLPESDKRETLASRRERRRDNITTPVRQSDAERKANARKNLPESDKRETLASRRERRRDNITTPVRQSDAERKANARKNLPESDKRETLASRRERRRDNITTPIRQSEAVRIANARKDQPSSDRRETLASRRESRRDNISTPIRQSEADRKASARKDQPSSDRRETLASRRESRRDNISTPIRQSEADRKASARKDQPSSDRRETLASRRESRRDNISTPIRQSEADRKANARKDQPSSDRRETLASRRASRSSSINTSVRQNEAKRKAIKRNELSSSDRRDNLTSRRKRRLKQLSTPLLRRDADRKAKDRFNETLTAKRTKAQRRREVPSTEKRKRQRQSTKTRCKKLYDNFANTTTDAQINDDELATPFDDIERQELPSNVKQYQTEMAELLSKWKTKVNYCHICKEKWPTISCTTPTSCCRKCVDQRKSRGFRLNRENNMDPGDQPNELRDLTNVEELLIAQCTPIFSLWRMSKGGQLCYHGNIINLPQDVHSFCRKLPRSATDLSILIVRKKGLAGSYKDFRVRRDKILAALKWLKMNNRYYNDIEIDFESIERLPIDGQLEGIPEVVDDSDDETPINQQTKNNEVDVLEHAVMVDGEKEMPRLPEVESIHDECEDNHIEDVGSYPNACFDTSTNTKHELDENKTVDEEDCDDNDRLFDSTFVPMQVNTKDDETIVDNAIRNMLQKAKSNAHHITYTEELTVDSNNKDGEEDIVCEPLDENRVHLSENEEYPQDKHNDAKESENEINNPKCLSNKEDFFNWPDRDEANPVNEFTTEGYVAVSFPSLYCTGEADLNAPRNLRVSPTEYFKHFMRYYGKDGFRFSKHYLFRYFALNTLMRHRCLETGKMYMKYHQQYKDFTASDLEKLHEKEQSKICNSIIRFPQNIRAGIAFWLGARADVVALVDQKSTLPAFFITISSPDLQCPDLHEFIGAYSSKSKAVNENPMLVDYFFTKKIDLLLKHVLGPKGIGATDYWARYEFQHRGSVHLHGIFWMDEKSQPDVRKLQDREANTEELRLQIITYFEKYVSCVNPAFDNNGLRNETWVPPRIHPSSIRLSSISNEESDEDLLNLLMTFQRHTKYIVSKTYLEKIAIETKGQKKEKNADAACSENLVNSEGALDKLNDNGTAYLNNDELEQYNKSNVVVREITIKDRRIVQNDDNSKEVYDEDMSDNDYSTDLTYDENLPFENSQINDLDDILQETIETSEHSMEEDAVEVVSEGSDCNNQPCEDKPFRYELKFRRNDPLINNFNRTMTQLVRGNTDIQPVIDEKKLLQYIVKYVAKKEPKSISFVQTMKEILAKSYPEQPFAKFVGRLMIKILGDRDFGAQETTHILMGTPLVLCSRQIMVINLEGNREVQVQEGSEVIVMPNAVDKYVHREKALEHLSLFEVYQNYRYIKKKFEKLPKKTIVRFFPNPSANPNGPNYEKYCEYYLMRYKHFTDHADLLNEFETYAEAKDHFATGHENPRTFDDYYHEHENDAREDDEDLSDDDTPLNDLYQDEWMLLLQNRNIFPVIDDESFDWTQSSLIYGNQIDETKTFIQRAKIEFQPVRKNKSVDLTKLNKGQLRAFNHVKESFHSSDSPIKPLLMIVTGTAGTGKSYLIDAIVSYLNNNEDNKDRCIVTAPTGKAACVVSGQTCHSAFHLPVGNSADFKELKGQSLNSLQQELKGIQCIIIDEMSMVGRCMFGKIDQRLRQAFPSHSNDILGRCSMILLGDFGQLPPVADTPLYCDGPRTGQCSNLGRMVYCQFDTAVVLTEVVRQKGDTVYRDICQRLRDGDTTQEDYDLLATRFIGSPQVRGEMKDFEDAIVIHTKLVKVAEDNHKRMIDSKNPIADLQGEHNNKTAEQSTSNESGGLSSKIMLRAGSKIMLTSNVWTAAGLCNGTIGDIVDIVYVKDGPPCLPDFIICHFDDYVGPTWVPPFDSEDKKLVPIIPIERTFYIGSVKCTRRNYPIQLAWSSSVHKAQGLTLPREILDIDDHDYAVGLTFVGCSRVTSSKNILLYPFAKERLDSIGKSKSLRRRQFEDLRLAKMDGTVPLPIIKDPIQDNLLRTKKPISKTTKTSQKLKEKRHGVQKMTNIRKKTIPAAFECFEDDNEEGLITSSDENEDDDDVMAVLDTEDQYDEDDNEIGVLVTADQNEPRILSNFESPLANELFIRKNYRLSIKPKYNNVPEVQHELQFSPIHLNQFQNSINDIQRLHDVMFDIVPDSFVYGPNHTVPYYNSLSVEFIRAKGDGNCFYRTVAIALFGCDSFENVKKLRNLIVETILDNEHLRNYSDDNNDINSWRNMNPTHGTVRWATEREFLALSLLFNISIKILVYKPYGTQRLSTFFWVTYNYFHNILDIAPANYPISDIIYMKHAGQDHFDLIIDVDVTM